MGVPSNLKYTESHEWVRTEGDGLVTVGITEFAQDALGDLVFVDLPEVGRELVAGEACAVVESVKAASDVYAPLAGRVVEINEALRDAPEKINEGAFDAWMFRLQPAAAADTGRLLGAAAYEANIAAQK
jgi:glycine cleavage system H protein